MEIGSSATCGGATDASSATAITFNRPRGTSDAGFTRHRFRRLAALTNSAVSGRLVDATPLIAVPGTGESVTNYVDPSARTNWPLRFYRVRLAQ
jgi:hypothetical protein